MRRRILQLYERGKRTREIAQFFGFCVAAVRRVRQQFRQRGTLQPRTHCSGRRTLLTKERKQRLQELRNAGADPAISEIPENGVTYCRQLLETLEYAKSEIVGAGHRLRLHR